MLNVTHITEKAEAVNPRLQKTKTIIYALFFFLTLFFQCMVFHYLAFHTYYGSSIIYDPVSFWAFYFPKISICLFFAAFVPLFKKKGWTIVVSFVMAVWILAELVYYRVNGILIDAYSFTMIGNMQGFWNSVFAFIRPVDIVIILPTVALAFFILWLQPCYVSPLSAAIFLFFSVAFHLGGALLINKKSDLREFDSRGTIEFDLNPFSENGYLFFGGFTSQRYSSDTSIIHCFVFNIWNLIKLSSHDKNVGSSFELDTDSTKLLFNKDHYIQNSAPKTRLYIILFESFENWAISSLTTPQIYDFIQSHENILWAKKVVKQTKAGISGDGQMIVNTGVLPVSIGATSLRFPRTAIPP